MFDIFVSFLVLFAYGLLYSFYFFWFVLIVLLVLSLVLSRCFLMCGSLFFSAVLLWI